MKRHFEYSIVRIGGYHAGEPRLYKFNKYLLRNYRLINVINKY